MGDIGPQSIQMIGPNGAVGASPAAWLPADMT